MNGKTDDLESFVLIHQWVTKVLEGTATEEEQRTLQNTVIENEEYQREYIRYMQELAQINSRLVLPQTPEVPSTVSQKTGGISRPRLPLAYEIIATAAVILLASLATWFGVQAINGHSKEESVAENPPATSIVAPGAGVEVATLLESKNVVWDSLHGPIDDLIRLSIGQPLCIHQGTLRLVFDSGVEALVLGPCQLQIQDRDRVYCSYGRIAAKASKDGKGFVIETPSARVTDLGTEFGVAISDSGETEVAVFEGAVDVEHTPSGPHSDPLAINKREHLVQGQATLVGLNGQYSRVFSVNNARLPGVRDSARQGSGGPVISSVRDNASEQSPENRMFYRIIHSGLNEDCQAYVDRDHQWNGSTEQGLPKFLIGADYVMPFNDDKFSTDLRIQVTIAEPATLYVFFSNNTLVPEWLSTEFVDTRIDIGLDQASSRYKPKLSLATGPAASIDNTFSVWKREVNEPQEIKLGSFKRPDDVLRGYNMYGIAAVAHQKRGN